MNERYDDRYRRGWSGREDDRREQRTSSWRDEGSRSMWAEREGFHQRNRRPEERPRSADDWDDDRGRQSSHPGTWSAGHGGFTDSAYGGGLAAWQDDRERRRSETEPGEPQMPSRGNYAGRGPRSYRRSDARIEEEINERLTMHGEIDATEVEVYVKDGEVTFQGTVQTRYEKGLAEECAWETAGVRDVHNRLRRSATGEGAPTGTRESGETRQERRTETSSGGGIIDRVFNR